MKKKKRISYIRKKPPVYVYAAAAFMAAAFLSLAAGILCSAYEMAASGGLGASSFLLSANAALCLWHAYGRGENGSQLFGACALVCLFMLVFWLVTFAVGIFS